MSNIDLVNEFPGISATGGEDGRAVTVRIRVDHMNGVVQRFGGQNDQDRSEDLLLVALHVRLYVGNHRWSDEVALLKAFDHEIGAVQNDFCALAWSVFNDALYFLFGLRRDDRTDVRAFAMSGIDLQTLRTLNDVWNPVSCFTNQNCSRPILSKDES